MSSNWRSIKCKNEDKGTIEAGKELAPKDLRPQVRPLETFASFEIAARGHLTPVPYRSAKNDCVSLMVATFF